MTISPDMIPRLDAALRQLKTEGGKTYGINAVIEVVQTAFNLNYSQVAASAKVSVAGLKRWRENDYGDAERVQIFLEWIEASKDPHAPPAPRVSPKDAMLKHALGDLEATLTASLQKLLGVSSVTQVQISELKPCLDGTFEMKITVA